MLLVWRINSIGDGVIAHLSKILVFLNFAFTIIDCINSLLLELLFSRVDSIDGGAVAQVVAVKVVSGTDCHRLEFKSNLYHMYVKFMSLIETQESWEIYRKDGLTR